MTQLKHLSLHPVFNLYIDDEMDYHSSMDIGKAVLNSVLCLVINSKSLEHLSLGFGGFIYRNFGLLEKILFELSLRHGGSLKSLHLSTCAQAASAYLANEDVPEVIVSLESTLARFVHLRTLSVDFDQVSDGLIEMLGTARRLVRLNLNVNAIAGMSEAAVGERRNAWWAAVVGNAMLRVCVNFVASEDAYEKFGFVLSEGMPLLKLRLVEKEFSMFIFLLFEGFYQDPIFFID